MCIVLDCRSLLRCSEALPQMTVIVLTLMMRFTRLFLLKLNVTRTGWPVLHFNMVRYRLDDFLLLLLFGLRRVKLGFPEHPFVARATHL